eukprot:GDKJ01048129.1.p1 GENE.GDKJ01048129.1~~GDKJ01048129.1.p1  ORF type:complete len:1702 (+),score=433.73 GDKJ01048129.1:721-5106(+)
MKIPKFWCAFLMNVLLSASIWGHFDFVDQQISIREKEFQKFFGSRQLEIIVYAVVAFGAVDLVDFWFDEDEVEDLSNLKVTFPERIHREGLKFALERFNFVKIDQLRLVSWVIQANDESTTKSFIRVVKNLSSDVVCSLMERCHFSLLEELLKKKAIQLEEDVIDKLLSTFQPLQSHAFGFDDVERVDLRFLKQTPSEIDAQINHAMQAVKAKGKKYLAQLSKFCQEQKKEFVHFKRQRMPSCSCTFDRKCAPEASCLCISQHLHGVENIEKRIENAIKQHTLQQNTAPVPVLKQDFNDWLSDSSECDGKKYDHDDTAEDDDNKDSEDNEDNEEEDSYSHVGFTADDDENGMFNNPLSHNSGNSQKKRGFFFHELDYVESWIHLHLLYLGRLRILMKGMRRIFFPLVDKARLQHPHSLQFKIKTLQYKGFDRDLTLIGLEQADLVDLKIIRDERYSYSFFSRQPQNEFTPISTLFANSNHNIAKVIEDVRFDAIASATDGKKRMQMLYTHKYGNPLRAFYPSSRQENPPACITSEEISIWNFMLFLKSRGTDEQETIFDDATAKQRALDFFRVDEDLLPKRLSNEEYQNLMKMHQTVYENEKKLLELKRPQATISTTANAAAVSAATVAATAAFEKEERRILNKLNRGQRSVTKTNNAMQAAYQKAYDAELAKLEEKAYALFKQNMRTEGFSIPTYRRDFDDRFYIFQYLHSALIDYEDAVERERKRKNGIQPSVVETDVIELAKTSNAQKKRRSFDYDQPINPESGLPKDIIVSLMRTAFDKYPTLRAALDSSVIQESLLTHDATHLPDHVVFFAEDLGFFVKYGAEGTKKFLMDSKALAVLSARVIKCMELNRYAFTPSERQFKKEFDEWCEENNKTISKDETRDCYFYLDHKTIIETFTAKSNSYLGDKFNFAAIPQVVLLLRFLIDSGRAPPITIPSNYQKDWLPLYRRLANRQLKIKNFEILAQEAFKMNDPRNVFLFPQGFRNNMTTDKPLTVPFSQFPNIVAFKSTEAISEGFIKLTNLESWDLHKKGNRLEVLDDVLFKRLYHDYQNLKFRLSHPNFVKLYDDNCFKADSEKMFLIERVLAKDPRVMVSTHNASNPPNTIDQFVPPLPCSVNEFEHRRQYYAFYGIDYMNLTPNDSSPDYFNCSRTWGDTFQPKMGVLALKYPDVFKFTVKPSWLISATSENNYRDLRILLKFDNLCYPLDIVQDAFENKKFKAVTAWIESRKLPTNFTFDIDFSCCYGDVECLRFLTPFIRKGSIKIFFTGSAVDDASINGHLDVLEWFKQLHRDGLLEIKTNKKGRGVQDERVQKWWLQNFPEMVNEKAFEKELIKKEKALEKLRAKKESLANGEVVSTKGAAKKVRQKDTREKRKASRDDDEDDAADSADEDGSVKAEQMSPAKRRHVIDDEDEIKPEKIKEMDLKDDDAILDLELQKMEEENQREALRRQRRSSRRSEM